MKYRNNSCYDLSRQPKDVFKKKHKIGMSIMVPFLQVFDTFHYMNKVINITNEHEADFWALEQYYDPINSLFLLCQITNKQHKEQLHHVIYSTASKRVGEKDFKSRAKQILALMELTLTKLGRAQSIAE